ncbi:nucleotidyltransferase family protein [Streptomyces sp. NBC_00102]|uniref:nucleotidyltransferase family protein n=1 Tax=Streptomyces sp. NBC_00102 TaxID=2975652 RepID=UPI00225BD510|nr:nucleotidyltransferase family protein [Streptomyces sp. NBC_00102]MCX5402278.1 nucleotidyltransferase family protein [Streptomyces sp. NBC_00102]
MLAQDFEVRRSDLSNMPFSASDLHELAGAPPEEQALAFASTVMRNPTITAVLERLSPLDLPPWYLTAGSLFQTVWNAAAGREDLNHGIRDHDLFFYDPADLSYEAEDLVIKKCLNACEDLGVEVEPRNQARVHLWYGGKYGKDIPQYSSLAHAISSFAATCCCVAVNLNEDGVLSIHTTHGFEDLFNGVLRPSPVTIAPRQVYEDKAARWMEVWPALRKLPWPQDSDAG